MGENALTSSIIVGGRVGAVGAAIRWVIRLATRRFGGAFRQSIRRGIRRARGVIGPEPYLRKGSGEGTGIQLPNEYPWS